MSASGQYQTATTNTYVYGALIYTSSDYGTSWEILPDSPAGHNFSSVSISATGQYQLISYTGDIHINGGCYYSTTYGNTWSQITNLPASSYSYGTTALSASGQYQAVGSLDMLHLSSNYGNTWTSLTTESIVSVKMSSSGQYITYVGDGINTSTNYGASFTKTPTGNYSSLASNSMSGSGQYQLAAEYVPNNNLYLSINYGSTWNTINLFYGFQFYFYRVCMSYTGQYQIVSTTSNNRNYYNPIVISKDYGKQWDLVNTNIIGTGYASQIAMSASGQYLSLGVSNNAIYSSNLYITQAKSFIIDHPYDDSKYLVHACLEGPEVGVYYRGRGEIINNTCVEVSLPEYVCAFASDFTIKVTSIYDGNSSNPKVYSPGEIINNRFTVYGENGHFFWTVTGSRGNILVEPEKSSIVVKGDGPYKWYE
jgi:photosystem II stability/assembly factor-like uncharacterized protein